MFFQQLFLCFFWISVMSFFKSISTKVKLNCYLNKNFKKCVKSIWSNQTLKLTYYRAKIKMIESTFKIQSTKLQSKLN